MKATIWSAMVPSHILRHRTEKRTQNTNWKTAHMLDSTIWWKAEYSHPMEKKKKCCHLLTLKYFCHTVTRTLIGFIQLWGNTFCSETHFPLFLAFFSISLPTPLRALLFRFLFIALSAHCLLSVILSKAKVKVVFKNLFCLWNKYLLNYILLPFLLIQIYIFIWSFQENIYLNVYTWIYIFAYICTYIYLSKYK